MDREDYIKFAKAWARVDEIQQVEQVLEERLLGDNNPNAIKYAIRELRRGGEMGHELADDLQAALDCSCLSCGDRKGCCECGGEG